MSFRILKQVFVDYLKDCLIYSWIFLKYFLRGVVSLVYARSKSVKGQVVLITGSAGYLGRYLAIEFVKKQATVVLWDVNEAKLDELRNELKSMGYFKVHTYRVDLTDRNQLRNASNLVKEEVGNVGMIVMAAAPSFKPRSIMDADNKDELDKHFMISYMSPLWIMQEFLPIMIAAKNGHIVCVSSGTALVDMPMVSCYASFKLAQTKLVESVREELIANGIRCVKTTIVYLPMLKGGLVDEFRSILNIQPDWTMDGLEAAQKIINGVLKNKQYLFLPGAQRFYTTLKFLFSPRLLGDLVLHKVRFSPESLRLRNKQE